MKTKTYIPIECDIFYDNRMSALINKMGVAGYGVYMILLVELRKRKDYNLDSETLRLIMRQYNIKRKQIEEVLYNFDLFTVEIMNDDHLLVTSEYVTTVMQNYDEKVSKCSNAGKKSANKRKELKNQRPLNSVATTEQNITDQNITEEKEEKETPPPAVVLTDAATKVTAEWRRLLDEALSSLTWVECQAKHSGLGARFLKYQKQIVDLFENHVVTHGKEQELRSLGNVKYYFANFVRQKTVTNKVIIEELDKLELFDKANDPYRFEQRDPQSGQRTYFGKIIPPQAPPRPNNNAVWAEDVKRWI